MWAFGIIKIILNGINNFSQVGNFQYTMNTIQCVYSIPQISWYINPGTCNGLAVQHIYSADIVRWLVKSAEQIMNLYKCVHFQNICQQICCYFNNNAYCKSNGKTATEYETISNHIISATCSNRVILWTNLSRWLASTEQMPKHLKCLLLMIKHTLVLTHCFWSS